MSIRNQKNNFNIAMKPLALAISCALFGQVATAEEAAIQQKGAGIERISVTAQKRLSSLQETPVAITAFDADSLENLGIKDISDVSSIAPNTNVAVPIGSAFNVGVTIRGLGTLEPSLTVDPKVGIYLDGVYLARNSGAIFSIIDLERMEVLRGPQGTLWGKNTTGGAINMVTKKPSDDFEFQQKLTFGSDGLFNSTTSIDTGEFNSFTAKLTYMTSEEDGWAKNTYAGAKEKNLGAKETDAFRIAVRYLGDDFSVDYSYDNTDGSAVAVPVQASNVRPEFTDPTIPTLHMGTGKFYGGNVFAMMAANEFTGGRQESFEVDNQGREYVEISGHNLSLEWDYLDNHSFKSITSYRDYSSNLTEADLDGGAYFGVELDATFQPTGNYAPIPAFHYTNNKEQNQTSQEFQLLGEFMDGKLGYVAGYYYFTEEGEEYNPWDINLFTGQGFNAFFSDPLPWGVFYSVESEAQALFAQVNYQVSDALNITVGLRHTKDEKSLIQLAENDAMLSDDLSAKKDWSKTVGSFIANYVVDNDLTIYGKVTQGYAAGTFNSGSIERFASYFATGQANFEGSLTPADPEDTLAYEIGAKAMMLDDRIMFNSAIFYNDNTNLQVTVQESGIRYSLNSGESNTIGFEFDAKFAATEDLIFSATYGYRDTEYTDETFSDFSTFSASLAMSWTFAKFDFGNLALYADYVMNDEFQFSIIDDSMIADSYNLLNARLTLSEIKVGQNSSLKVSVFGRNITDEEYVLHGANLGFFETRSYGAPASYGVDVTFDF